MVDDNFITRTLNNKITLIPVTRLFALYDVLYFVLVSSYEDLKRNIVASSRYVMFRNGLFQSAASTYSLAFAIAILFIKYTIYYYYFLTIGSIDIIIISNIIIIGTSQTSAIVLRWKQYCGSSL